MFPQKGKGKPKYYHQISKTPAKNRNSLPEWRGQQRAESESLPAESKVCKSNFRKKNPTPDSAEFKIRDLTVF